MGKTVTLKVQQVGTQLGVCIPADIAQATQLVAGRPVTLHIPTTSEEIGNAEESLPTLAEMLAQYDPEKFNGEVMAAPLIGRETIK